MAVTHFRRVGMMLRCIILSLATAFLLPGCDDSCNEFDMNLRGWTHRTPAGTCWRTADSASYGTYGMPFELFFIVGGELRIRYRCENMIRPREIHGAWEQDWTGSVRRLWMDYVLFGQRHTGAVELRWDDDCRYYEIMSGPLKGVYR